MIDARHRVEWDLVTTGRTNSQIVEVGERSALVARVAHHDANVVSSALDALRFCAIERLAYLAGQIFQRDPEGFGARQQRQFDLLLAILERIRDVDHAGVFGQAQLHPIGHSL